MKFNRTHRANLKRNRQLEKLLKQSELDRQKDVDFHQKKITTMKAEHGRDMREAEAIHDRSIEQKSASCNKEIDKVRAQQRKLETQICALDELIATAANGAPAITDALHTLFRVVEKHSPQALSARRASVKGSPLFKVLDSKREIRQ